jgi:spermidine synthase
VIGVVLAGLSLGNWLGGRIADRRPGRSTLSVLYLASAIASGVILVLQRSLDSIAAPISWPAILQTLWLVSLLFFLPSVLLGSVTPMIVKLSLSSLDATGRVVGRIQAAASLGSILGVFATGFFLISVFGTQAVVAGVTIALLALAVLSNPPWEATSKAAQGVAANVGITAAVVLVLAIGLTATYNGPCVEESNYYCIRVDTTPEGYKELSLDLLIHGVVSPRNPAQPIYPYEQLYAEMVDAKYGHKRPVSAFAIGGGTYTFPQYLERYHHGHTIVAEIDKDVTKVAHEQFGLRDSPGIENIQKDARPVLEDRPKSELYDMVLGDAFGDIAIPYHLTTKEFNQLVASHLKPDGIYLVNVVDGIHYDFLRAYMKTLSQTFPYVQLQVTPGQAATGEQDTFVVAASKQPLPQLRTTVPAAQFQQFMAERSAITLTDDHTPVDQLLAPVFRQRLQTKADTETPGA